VLRNSLRQATRSSLTAAPAPSPAAHLLGRLHGLKHFVDTFGWRKTQVCDQQRQVDPELLGRLDATSGTRMAEPFFRPRKLEWGQSTPAPHIHYDRLR
jgi:hypothetical protein